MLIFVMVPTTNRIHDYQDHSSRLFQFFPAVSRKLLWVIGFVGFYTSCFSRHGMSLRKQIAVKLLPRECKSVIDSATVAIVYRIHDNAESSSGIEPHCIEEAKADPHVRWHGGCHQQWRRLSDFGPPTLSHMPCNSRMVAQDNCARIPGNQQARFVSEAGIGRRHSPRTEILLKTGSCIFRGSHSIRESGQ